MDTPRTPGIRRHSTRNYLTPPVTPDRYISNRFSPQEASKSFRLSKSPHQLSSSERLLRHPSATPDPFGPLIVQRRREARDTTLVDRDDLAMRFRNRTMGITHVLALPRDTLALQNRQASAGAIWNVGGSTPATHSGPICSVSNGRGGFLSSGSNAPMFTSHFFDDDLLDHSMERMESRLAAALDIDLTSRVLNNSRLSPTTRSASTSSFGVKRKAPYTAPRTHWKHGEWTQGGSQSRKSTHPLVTPLPQAPRIGKISQVNGHRPCACVAANPNNADCDVVIADTPMRSSEKASEDRVQSRPQNPIQISPPTQVVV